MFSQFQKLLYWAATLSFLPKILLSVAVVVAAVFILVVLWGPTPTRLSEQSSSTGPKESTDAAGTATSQRAEVSESPNANVYQAGRDIIITEQKPIEVREQTLIDSMLVEARLTCIVRQGAELPPDEVTFMPVGDSHAYLEGPAGRVRLSFQSPVRFRRLDNDRLVVTNRFLLDPGSEVHRRPLDVLQNYRTLSVPVVTVVWGRALETIKLLEVSVFVNNQGPLYGSWEYDVAFQQGPRFAVEFQLYTNRLFQPV